MNILLGHDQSVADWVSARVGKPFHAPFVAVGTVDRTGKLNGGLVFTDCNGSNIELSLAGSGVASRGVWRAVLSYVFDQLGCVRLQIHTATENRAVRKFAPRLGFAFEGKSRNFYGSGKDALRYSLTTNDLPAFRARWRL